MHLRRAAPKISEMHLILAVALLPVASPLTPMAVPWRGRDSHADGFVSHGFDDVVAVRGR